MMRRAPLHLIATAGAMCFCFPLAGGHTVSAAALRVAQTIPLSGVEGRIDHLAVDVPANRLFLCALGNNSVEIIDLKKGERVHSIAGLGNPQGVAYAFAQGRLYVANDKEGACNIYDGESFALLGRIDFKDDADNVRYDSAAKRIYVGYGKGDLGIVDAETGKSVGSITLAGHPEAFVLEKDGTRIFINIPTARQVAVVDRAQGKLIATWKSLGAFANFPIALDESNHRLFIGCRLPAKLVVLNTESGAVVTSIGISGDNDDIFYDEKRHRLYAICGEGSVDVIDQIDRDTYRAMSTTETASGARTGLFVPELRSLFVAVPHRGNQVAEIRRYAVE